MLGSRSVRARSGLGAVRTAKNEQSSQDEVRMRAIGNWLGVSTGFRAEKLGLLFLLTGALLAGCSSGSSKSSVTVSVSPATAQVTVGLTAKFTATVSGASDTGVTWKVNGKSGGNATVGTISTTGLYTAPSSVPNPATVTLTAVSNADNNAGASATVTIVGASSVTVSPAAATVASGATQQFVASVEGLAGGCVDWTVNGASGGEAGTGTISSSGLYTAPPRPPSGGSVTVTATSCADSSASASATVSIVFGAGALKGQYAFSVKGRDANGMMGRIGSIVTDGVGNVTSGVLDLTTAKASSTVLINSGTYTVGADGRGTLSLTNNTAGTITFYLSLASNTRGFLVESDASAQAGGDIYKQDTSAFLASAFSGAYVFGVSGVDSSNHPISIVGRFTSDGNGHLSNGVLDQNEDYTLSSAVSFTASSYQLDATYGFSYGRSVASINGWSFVVYLVDGSRAEFLETDYPAVAVGEAYTQQTNSGSLTALTGNYAFLVSGPNLVRGGRFTADGGGNLTSVVLVENSGGNAILVPSSGADQGTYTLASSGRGTLTITDKDKGSYKYVFYLASSGQAVLQDTSKGFLADGQFLTQTDTAISTDSLAGSYALSFRETYTGDFGLSGKLKLPSTGSGKAEGTMDYNDSGDLSPNLTFTATMALSGDGTGRNTLSITETADSSKSFGFDVFVIDTDSLFLVGINKDHVLAGLTQRQF
jgi:hypothetical protein